jgi:hypothetical protein
MLFDASVAVHVTVVVPTGNCDPAGGLHTTVDVPQLSVAVGVVKFTGALVENGHDGCAVAVIAAGHPFGNTGTCVSLTVTMKMQLASGLTPLDAVQLTVVVPTGNVCGDVITVAPSLHATVGAGIPVAPTEKLTEAEHCPGLALTTIGLAGHVIVGATPIWTVTSANESGQGGFEIVHLSFTCPLPVRWVHVAFELKVPVNPAVAMIHVPVPELGVLPPIGAVVPPGEIV